MRNAVSYDTIGQPPALRSHPLRARRGHGIVIQCSLVYGKRVKNLGTRCYIAGAGDFCDYGMPEHGDFIIAADGGYAQLTARGITPDLVVGDFDSLGCVPEHPNIVRIPAEKDDTDTLFAVREGFKRGCKTFIINGGLGGRPDHSFANIQTLVFIANSGAHGILLGGGMCVTAITNETLSFLPGSAGTVSVFCAGSIADGVSLTGLKYSLDNAKLTGDFPIGVSNEFTGAPATVAVRTGTLIVIWEGGPEALVTQGDI